MECCTSERIIYLNPKEESRENLRKIKKIRAIQENKNILRKFKKDPGKYNNNTIKNPINKVKGLLLLCSRLFWSLYVVFI